MSGPVIHPIPGFPGYGATEDGRIWSAMKGPWHSLKLVRNAWKGKGVEGYLKVKMHRKTMKVHALIALVFIGPRPNGMVINHIDMNKTNNAPSNLEYITQRQNCVHAFLFGGKPFRPRKPKKYKPKARKGPCNGESVPGHKLTSQDVAQLRDEYAGGEVSQRELGRRYGVSQTVIHRIVTRAKWRHVP